MDAEKLHGFILNGIKASESKDRFEISLPFPLCGNSIPFTVVWKTVKSQKLTPYARRLRQMGYTVERRNEYPYYEISDGGRILDEFESRVGDIKPYKEKIESILKITGMFELSGGRTIRMEYEASSTYIHVKYLNDLLMIAALITNLDILPYTKDEFDRGDCNV